MVPKIVSGSNISVVGEEIRVEEKLISADIVASSQITNTNSQVEKATNSRRQLILIQKTARTIVKGIRSYIT